MQVWVVIWVGTKLHNDIVALNDASITQFYILITALLCLVVIFSYVHISLDLSATMMTMMSGCDPCIELQNLLLGVLQQWQKGQSELSCLTSLASFGLFHPLFFLPDLLDLWRFSAWPLLKRSFSLLVHDLKNLRERVRRRARAQIWLQIDAWGEDEKQKMISFTSNFRESSSHHKGYHAALL